MDHSVRILIRVTVDYKRLYLICSVVKMRNKYPCIIF